MIKLDDYGEVVNSLETYQAIAEYLEGGGVYLIGWIDEEGSHFDILFSYKPLIQQVPVLHFQGGIRGNELFVSILRVGAWGFDINKEVLHPSYINEKLGISGSTADKLAELITGVKKALYDRP